MERAMSYSFDSADASVQAGLRRIALDQIDSALAESEDSDLPPAERIHQVRKRCKKLRGMIRLVRPCFDAYPAENAALRDAAKRLSDVRDAAALVETCDRVRAHFDEQLAGDAFDALREALAAEARAREAAGDVAERLDLTRKDLRAARSRAERWTLEKSGADAVAGGLRTTYGRARTAMTKARKNPTGERLHDWRKRVKYHWYHLRLLKQVAPVIRAQVEPADDLSDLLGDHHDLVVMEPVLETCADVADPATIEAFRGLMRERRRRLECRAFLLGRQVLAEKPKALSRRVAAYWAVWEDALPEAS
jgi:CHAD domain-containing protein